MDEQVYYEGKPAKKVIVIWIFTKLLYFLTFLVFFGFSVFLKYSLPYSYWFTVGVFVIFILFIVYLYFLQKTYHYKITDKGAYFSGGIIIRKQKFVPSYKITNIVTSQNIIERALGINKIGIQTAGMGGYARPEIVFEGLVNPTEPADILRDLLKKTQAGYEQNE